MIVSRSMKLVLAASGIAFAALAVVSCSQGGPSSAPGSSRASVAVSEATGMALPAESVAPAAAARQRAGDSGSVTSPGNQPADATIAAMNAARHLIRTGSLVLEVEDADAASRRVEGVATENEGYVSSLQGSTDPWGRRTSTIAIRVPPPRFMPALAALRTLGRVESDAVTTEDVGREYADVESRLRTKLAVAARMEQILSGKTASLQDLMYAEQQLAAVREQIEQLEGQRRYFDSRTALSTISVTVRQPGAAMTVAAGGPPLFQPLREALVTARGHSIQVLAAVSYVVVVFGPWLALTALIWLLVQRLRKRRETVPAR